MGLDSWFPAYCWLGASRGLMVVCYANGINSPALRLARRLVWPQRVAPTLNPYSYMGWWTYLYLHPKWSQHTQFNTTLWANACDQSPLVHPIRNPTPLCTCPQNFGNSSSTLHTFVFTFNQCLCYEQTLSSNASPPCTLWLCCTSMNPFHSTSQGLRDCWDSMPPTNWWVVVYLSVHSIIFSVLCHPVLTLVSFVDSHPSPIPIPNYMENPADCSLHLPLLLLNPKCLLTQFIKSNVVALPK